jgi:hypothetical protein
LFILKVWLFDIDLALKIWNLWFRYVMLLG